MHRLLSTLLCSVMMTAVVRAEVIRAAESGPSLAELVRVQKEVQHLLPLGAPGPGGAGVGQPEQRAGCMYRRTDWC